MATPLHVIAAAKAVASAFGGTDVGGRLIELRLSDLVDPRRWKNVHVDQALLRVSSGTIGEAQKIICGDPLAPLDCWPEAYVRLKWAAKRARLVLRHDCPLDHDASVRAYADAAWVALYALAEAIKGIPEIGLLVPPRKHPY